MKLSWKSYIALAVVFFLSLMMTLILPSDIFKGLAAMPATGALLYALYQIFRDQAAFEKQKYLQRQQQIFNLGSTSHMANVAFDKHVEFCEHYMEEVHNTINTLFQEGPTTKALDHSRNLFNMKRRYAAWIPQDVALTLEPFEKAISEIGTGSRLRNMQTGPDTLNLTEKTWGTLNKIMDKNLNAEHREVAVEEQKQRIRAILGIEELTKMRTMLVKEALSFLEKNN
jgi:hypothetical protein